MNWFNKPSRPIRNTTGYSGSALVTGSYGHSASRPHAGVIKQHVGLPPVGSLSAHVPDPRKPGTLTVGMAKKHLDQIERPVVTVSDQVTARTQGRTKQFLKSAANVAGKVVGIGRGPAPPAATPQWVRPDVPAVTITTKRPLFETRAQAALRRQAADDVATKADGFLATYKLPLHEAMDRFNAVAGKASHVEGVHQSLLASVGQARVDQAKAAEAFEAAVGEFDKATNQVQLTGSRLTKLEAHKTRLDATARSITSDMRANTARRAELEAKLATLPPIPASREVREADRTYRHDCAALKRTETRLQRREENLAQAQTNLDQAKQRMRGTRPFSQERATCRAQVIQCRAARNQARVLVEVQQALLADRKNLVKQSGDRANALDSQRGSGAREAIQMQLQDVKSERDALRNTALGVGLALRECVAQLPGAREAHEKAKELELKCRIDMESAGRAVTSKREIAEKLTSEMERIEPVRRALVPDVQKASLDLKVLNDMEAVRSSERIRDMTLSPPGFERIQITPGLQTRMELLVEHLHAVPPGLDDQQAMEYRRDRIPDEHALEIVSRCLSLATGGRGDVAEKVLAELMSKDFAGLVPAPGKNFSGQDMVLGNVQDDESELKRFASLIAARPSGVELLMRTVQPVDTKPSRQLQDAVDVYFKATNALAPGNRPKDADSVQWLHYAEQGAKMLAHPDPALPNDGNSAMEALARVQRVAFNGVRNGYTSIAPGSNYDKADRALTKLSTKWVSRANEHSYKNSPLHARHMASKVGADVGLPTIENKLSQRLGTICDELLKRTGGELLAARSRVAQARQLGAPANNPPAVPYPLLEAHALLQHIQKRAEKGEPLHSMSLSKKDWRAIENEAKKLHKIEARPARAGVGTLGEMVNELRAGRSTDHDGSALAQNQGSQPDFSGLGLSLLDYQASRERPNLLTLLDDINQHLTLRAPSSQGEGSVASQDAQHFFDAVESEDQLDEIDFFDAVEEQSVTSLSDDEILNDPSDNQPELSLEQRPANLTAPSSNQAALQPLAQRLAALRDSSSASTNFQQHQADPAWTTAGADVGRQSPTMEDDDLSVSSQASVLSDLEAAGAEASAAQSAVNGVPDTVDVDGTAIADQTTLGKALGEAKVLQQLADRFASIDGEFTAEELTQWLGESVDGAFGRVAFNQGHQFSIGTSSLLGVYAELASNLGLLVRPDVELSFGSNNQIKAGRDALGTELSIGKQRTRTGTVGLTATLAKSMDRQEAFSYGPFLSVNHSRVKSTDTSGVVMRNPKFDGRTHDQLTDDFRDMVGTTLKWQDMKGPGGKALYSSPMEALLDRHPAISIATVESATSVATTGSTAAGLFVGGAHDKGDFSAFGGAGAAVLSTRTRDTWHFKTVGGTQGFVESSDVRLHTTKADAFAGYRGGFLDSNGRLEHLAGVRQNFIGFNGALNVRRTLAASGFDVVRMPDGSVVADRFVEFTSYEKFEAAVTPHRAKWIEAGMHSTSWPDNFSDADKRSVCEATFDEFMANAKESLKAGTVTLNENMDVTLEVSAMLTANLALEEVALLEGRTVDAFALRAARDKLLDSDSSYQPFLLKAVVRSNISHRKGVVLGLGGQATKGSSAAQVFDWYPRVEKRAIFKTMGDSTSPSGGSTFGAADTSRMSEPEGNLAIESDAANVTTSATTQGKSSAAAPVTPTTRPSAQSSSQNDRTIPGFPNLTRGTARGDGGCLFHSVIQLAGPAMARQLGQNAAGLTPDMVRRHVAGHVIGLLEQGRLGIRSQLGSFADDIKEIFNVDDAGDETPATNSQELNRLLGPDLARRAMALNQTELEHLAQLARPREYAGFASEVMPRLIADAFPGLQVVVHDARDANNPSPELPQNKVFLRSGVAAVETIRVFRSGAHYDPVFEVAATPTRRVRFADQTDQPLPTPIVGTNRMGYEV